MKNVFESYLKGAFVFKPNIFEDERGYFSEVYNHEKYKKYIPDRPFLQMNHSKSKGNVRRGLHFQYKKPQAKLIRVLKGQVMDVIVDLRVNSPTFGRSDLFMVSDENKLQVYVPRGFAHGFITLTDEVDFEYLCDEVYDPSGEICLNWEDPALSMPTTPEDYIISEKDAKGMNLAEIIALGVLV